MSRTQTITWRIYWIVAAASLAAAVAALMYYAPVEVTMGPIQKIFYVHLPSAINAFVGCAIVFVGSIGFLWQRRMKWDHLAASAARVAVLMCSLVLITGMVWARYAWGQWWTWSPRLTFSLLLWLLYVVYLVLRTSIESSRRRAVVCAVYGVAAFLDVPLVYLSVRLMPDIHPVSVEMVLPMKITLGVWFVPVTLISVGLIIAGYLKSESRAAAVEQDVLEAAS